MAAQRRTNWDRLSPAYQRRISRTIGRAAYERGAPLHAARGQRIETSRRLARAVAGPGVWIPAESTVRRWRSVAYSNNVSPHEFERELRLRGPKWVQARISAITRSRMMTDRAEKQEYMIAQYIDFRDFDVERQWFFYGR